MFHSSRLQADWFVGGGRTSDMFFLISFHTVANSGFLNILHRPNLTLNFDGIADIVENGIITKTGMYGHSRYYHLPHISLGEMLPFDVIVYATGFIGVSATYADLIFHKMPTAETGAIPNARSRLEWSHYPRLLRCAWRPYRIPGDCNSWHTKFLLTSW
jgi:hypothetical protein